MLKTSSTLNSKYLLRIGAIAACLALVLYAGIRLLLPPDEYEQMISEFDKVSDDVEIITLGNSRGQTFHFASMGLVGFHFFEPSGDLEEALRRADVVLDRLPSLNHVLLPLSPGALSVSQRAVADDYQERRLLVRKGTPLTLDPRGYSLEEIVSTAIYALFRISSLQDAFYGLVGYEAETRTVDARVFNHCFDFPPGLDFDSLSYAPPEEGIVDGYRRLIMRNECLSEYGKKNSVRHHAFVDKSRKTYPHMFEENFRRVVSLADRLGRRGVELIVVTTPSTPWYYDAEILADLRPQFEKVVGELIEHPNIRYHDFHDHYYDDLKNGENRYFFDDNHLALVGAKHFSEHFSRELNLGGSRSGRLGPRS